ncbi:MAG TPA: bifunctional aldolase/short-chain dehydrogenase [Thermoanaerobaculia bacterium]|nr:bifunctional aldolase/short-chain dehydrogenase [Thermoanaerobaculia bacterium]
MRRTGTQRGRWDEAAAREWAERTADPLLGLRVYSSRLLGADPSLVLHGGGNTSVKSTARDVLGEEVEVVWVKASGWDLATIEARGFAPLELGRARRLLDAPAMSDLEMMRELRRCRLDPQAPDPSVEALLHAFLPHRFVDHTHADAVLALIQTPDGPRRARELYGGDYLIVPYVKPGFDLAVECRRRWRAALRAGREPRGMILLHHGVFTFDDDPRASYERMLRCVALAEEALGSGGPRATSRKAQVGRSGSSPRGVSAAQGEAAPAAWDPAAIAALRAELSRVAGRPLLIRLVDDEEARRFADRPNLDKVALRGTLTPDHVLRTKPIPAVLRDPRRAARDLDRYAAGYRRYFARHLNGRPLTMLDPAPRILLAPGRGFFAAGPTARESAIAADIYRHTIAAIEAAEGLGGFRPLPPRHLFEVEYWDLEQAKLRRGGAPAPLAGRVALVTGAASGIGAACAAALRQHGAAVAGLDLRPSLDGGADLHLLADAADPAAVRAAVARTAERFGGIDALVSCVGTFPPSRRVEELDDDAWERTMDLNARSHLTLLRETIPLLRRAPAGGSVVLIGSRNVPAPGPGAAAYSASKAALTQLGRVAALELAADGIRVNILHPDAVFDTGLWSPEVIAERARHYGLSVEEYRQRNLLGAEVRAADVGALAAALCTDLFSRTTGAQIPVDGGNERVI